MPPTYEVQILGIGKKAVRDCFVCASPHYAKVLAKEKYGDWIRFGEVKEVLTKAQKALRKAQAVEAELLSQAEARRPQSKRWQLPAEADVPPGYLWG